MPSELTSELRTVVFGRASILDGIVPPIIFGVVNALTGVRMAALAALTTSILIVLARLLRGRSVKFALAGFVGVLIASLASIWKGPDGFFLPSIISGAATAVLIVISIIARRPFVAWTSWLARDWPIDWYWHPQVRPAYTTVSWMWAAFFATRSVGQWLTLENTGTATTFRVVAGWPALLVLLVATYIWGRRLLTRLAGPSVEEFAAAAPQPWTGQKSGF
ncbi:MAG: DUF3159 domain-containing protein [Acidimicrobiia bacterium]|nr:DUF3159 domain-containing protein [Acidimicrobiia bacterium]